LAVPENCFEYLEILRRELKGNPLLAMRVLEEVADHLAETVDAERRAGMSEQEAEASAVRRMGDPSRLARQFDKYGLPFRIILVLASLATALVGLWLLSVIAFVLPSRDPSHIPFWKLVATCFFAYSALNWAYLILGPRLLLLRLAVLFASIAAILAGIYGIYSMIQTANAGGHFEGYIILMGLILCGHGILALIYTSLSARVAGELRGA
jgi:cation transport ATPase